MNVDLQTELEFIQILEKMEHFWKTTFQKVENDDNLRLHGGISFKDVFFAWWFKSLGRILSSQ